MNFNNGFPVTYPQVTWPYQQQQAQQPQGMTPPTIHADIVQVESEKQAWDYPVAAGTSQMMMARDDSAIYIKSAFANSQPSMEVYTKAETIANRSEQYVTKDELKKMLEELKGTKEEKKA